jgi:hypothetical protein
MEPEFDVRRFVYVRKAGQRIGTPLSLPTTVSNLPPKKPQVDAIDQNRPLGRFWILFLRSFEGDLVVLLEVEGYSKEYSRTLDRSCNQPRQHY